MFWFILTASFAYLLLVSDTKLFLSASLMSSLTGLLVSDTRLFLSAYFMSSLTGLLVSDTRDESS